MLPYFQFTILNICVSKGGDFRRKITKAAKDKTKFSDAQILDWMTQATNGLKYLHEKCKIIHRDIKPA